MFGAPRQILITGRNLAGGSIDFRRRMLNAPDDIGQTFHRGVGIVAHAGEHAGEVAVHACGQVAAGDGLQHLRQRTQALVRGTHQLVEVHHDLAEVVLERGFVATRGEVACRCGRGQALDLAVDRQQAGAHVVERLADHRLLARQRLQLLRQIAGSIALGQCDDLHGHCDMPGHQCVAGAHHAAEFAWELLFGDTVADHAGFVFFAHFGLRLDHAAQLTLHAVHCLQQLSDLIVAVDRDGVVQLARRHRMRDAHGTVERLGDGARHEPAESNAYHRTDQAQDQAGDAGGDRAVHRFLHGAAEACIGALLHGGEIGAVRLQRRCHGAHLRGIGFALLHECRRHALRQAVVPIELLAQTGQFLRIGRIGFLQFHVRAVDLVGHRLGGRQHVGIACCRRAIEPVDELVQRGHIARHRVEHREMHVAHRFQAIVVAMEHQRAESHIARQANDCHRCRHQDFPEQR